MSAGALVVGEVSLPIVVARLQQDRPGSRAEMDLRRSLAGVPAEPAPKMQSRLSLRRNVAVGADTDYLDLPGIGPRPVRPSGSGTARHAGPEQPGPLRSSTPWYRAGPRPRRRLARTLRKPLRPERPGSAPHQRSRPMDGADARQHVCPGPGRALAGDDPEHTRPARLPLSQPAAVQVCTEYAAVRRQYLGSGRPVDDPASGAVRSGRVRRR